LNVRQYNNKEISAIIRRAVELKQQQARDRDGKGRAGKEQGVSLEDLQQIASELGIEPEYVLAAAQELVSDGKIQITRGFWGAPGFMDVEREVEGVIPESTWDELLVDIRRTMGETGRTEKIGNSLEWTGRHTHVSISTHGNKTVIRIGCESRQAIVLSYVLSFEAAMIGLAVLLPFIPLPNEFRFALAGGGVVGTGFLAREIAYRWARKKHARLQEMIERLMTAVQQYTQASLQEEALAQPRFSETEEEKQTENAELGVRNAE
jgi:hypothetical protein